MKHYICKSCGATSHSSADIEHLTVKTCEKCGGEIAEK